MIFCYGKKKNAHSTNLYFRSWKIQKSCGFYDSNSLLRTSVCVQISAPPHSKWKGHKVPCIRGLRQCHRKGHSHIMVRLSVNLLTPLKGTFTRKASIFVFTCHKKTPCFSHNYQRPLISNTVIHRPCFNCNWSPNDNIRLLGVRAQIKGVYTHFDKFIFVLTCNWWTLTPNTHFVQFYLKVASHFLSWGKNKNGDTGDEAAMKIL